MLIDDNKQIRELVMGHILKARKLYSRPIYGLEFENSLNDSIFSDTRSTKV